MVFENWLRAIGKLDYVQGKNRPDVDCILCAIRDDDERVKALKVYQDNLSFIVLNIYPYNPGHLMAVPTRHMTKFTELTKEEALHLFRVLQGLQLLLNDLYNPQGFNMGMNQGTNAGASIEHVHFHLVPRYPAEIGFIDIIGKARITPLGLDSVKKKIEESIKKYLSKKFFEDF